MSPPARRRPLRNALLLPTGAGAIVFFACFFAAWTGNMYNGDPGWHTLAWIALGLFIAFAATYCTCTLRCLKYDDD